MLSTDSGQRAEPTAVDDACLRGWPLPQPHGAADKETRGRLLIVGGSREIPGAVLLAAMAAMRAGGGKLLIATAASVAQGIALQLPEARVLALPETPPGGLAPGAAAVLEPFSECVDAVLIGPGMLDEAGSLPLVASLLGTFGQAAVVLDAAAMGVLARVRPFERVPLLTPHAGEMAHLSGRDKEEAVADPIGTAREAAARWNAIVALKGACTVIAHPDGRVWRHDAEVPGLATSGSGDVLAGIVVGLAARGASLEQAAVWGIALHARAGARLAERMAPLGFYAREIAAEVPVLMAAL